jgi:glycyl-tRNA synthetase
MPDLMEQITSLAKRRGIVFPSSEIYGGLRSSWDYGPLGVELKRNVKDAWWRAMVQLRDDVVGLDAAIIMSPKVWEASGHLEVFTDPLVECRNCHQRFRADDLQGEPKTCPNCGNHTFTDARNFNLMFRTHMGPVEDGAEDVYLRPETAQGMFVDFATVQQTSRRKVPFGIAQIGKAFRNEITPGNFIFRMREFEQMEMEFFVKPGTDEQWHDYWIQERLRWFTDFGVRADNLRLREHDADELSHYSKRTVDIEYRFPFTEWGELEGIANRTDYDLKAHERHSGEDLTYFDPETEERYHPFVIEPAVGVDRAILTFLIDAYRVEEAPTAKGGTEKRTLLALHKELAPIKAAVLPLSRNERLVPAAREVFDLLKPHWMCDYDDAGSIGRRYRRQDEVGTPFCVTVDFDTLDDRAATVRDRDSMTQERIPVALLVEHLRGRL